MKTYELTPNDRHKSFYGKAKVVIDDDGNKTLYSYGTRIITETAAGEYIKHWDDWSATTGRHIAAFCGLNKKTYTALPYNGSESDPGGRRLTNKEVIQIMNARREGKFSYFENNALQIADF